MSLYDQASLVLIPSGYKTSKLYSAKPTDGSGDLTFTRTGSTATRVNSSGLIEECRTNIFTYSQDFDNAAWTKQVGSISANQTAAPDGTLTADKLIDGVTEGVIVRNITTIAQPYIFSVFAKASERSGIQVATSYGGAIFSLTTGVASNVGSGITASSVQLSNGWWRLSISFNGTAANPGFAIYTAGSEAISNGVTGIFIYGAQLEQGDISTAYIPTTSAAVTVGPVANLPRLDYTGGGCPKLLMEPTRTNVLTYSESLKDASWNNAAVVTANTVASPDGYTNADTVTGVINKNFSVTSGTTYTCSVFAKKNVGSSFTLRADSLSNQSCSFDLDTLVAGSGGKIENYGNGWYRCSFTFTGTATGTGVFYIIPPTSIYLYGAQLEAGSYATSYIPTWNASVTRNGDNASKTAISSLIGQTDGTFVIDFIASAKNADGLSYSVIFLSGDATNNFQIYAIDNVLYWYFKAGATVFDQSANQTLTAGQRYKIAFGYKSGDFVLYINGVQKRTSTNTAIPTSSSLNLSSGFSGNDRAENDYNQLMIFKTRLSNTDLATLTTL